MQYFNPRSKADQNFTDSPHLIIVFAGKIICSVRLEPSLVRRHYAIETYWIITHDNNLHK